MSPAALLRHHTGRMAGPARWYLALLAMASLGLLAAHFAVQEHVQKKMSLAVHDWLQDGGGSVQHVRYHLLRGALTLEQVHWIASPDSGLTMNVSQISLRTSSRAMASGTPYFSLIHFEKPVLSVRRAQAFAWIRGDIDNTLSLLTGLLAHAKEVTVHDMALDISGEEIDAPHVSLIRQAQGRLSADGIDLKGKPESGQLMLQGLVDERGQLIGNIGLRDVPLGSLAVWSGTSSNRGSMASGDLLLHGDWQKRDIEVQGTLQLQDQSGEGTLAINGGWSATGATMDMRCSNVKLSGLPLVWPRLAGRELLAGRLNGELHIEHLWQAASHLRMDGELKGVRLDAPDLPAWQMQTVNLNHAEWSSGNGMLKARTIDIEDADIALNAFSREPPTSTATMPEVGELSLQHIRPRLHYSDATELTLPELEGKGRLGKKGHVSLSTYRRDADGSESAPVESWKVKAEGDFLAAWQAEVRAQHVPIVRLRPLLPNLTLPGEKGVPDYSGSSDLSLQMTSATKGLKVTGHAVFHDVSMAQGGEHLSATRIRVDATDAGSDGRRELSRVQVSDWQYQVGLRPLSRNTQAAVQPMSADVEGQSAVTKSDSGAVTESVEIAQGDVDKVTADLSAVQSTPSPVLNWKIAELSASEGRISLGQQDALIAEQLLFRARHLASGSLSAFTLSGVFGEGQMMSQGRLQLQPVFRMSSKTRVSSALPMVFNDWMRLSGMPRFVRGRLDANLRIDWGGKAADTQDQRNNGSLNISLHQGLLESGAFSDDPMVQRTGYTSQGLLERLNHTRSLDLAVAFKGTKDKMTLAGSLGEGVVKALKKAASKPLVAAGQAEPSVSKITRLRLRGKRGFSYNERVRLRQMIKYMLKDSALIVELIPQLGLAKLDADMIERVRQSQRMVEKFLLHNGIAAKRIYPVWPRAEHQRGDAPGLLLQARAF